MKYQKPTKEELEQAIHKTVPDIIAPYLNVLFCGINPGLYTAAIGHHFGKPGNRFWRALYEGGFTKRQYDPREDTELLKLGYGLTNLVPRATRAAQELTHEEVLQGATNLTKKILKYKPRWVAFVGIQAYRTGFSKPEAQVGKQPDSIGDSGVWVLPNPSGLNAHFRPTDFARLFAALRRELD